MPCLQAKKTAEKQLEGAEVKNAELSSALDALRSELQSTLDKETAGDNRTNELEGGLEDHKAHNDDLGQRLSTALAVKEVTPQVRPVLPSRRLAKDSSIKVESWKSVSSEHTSCSSAYLLAEDSRCHA